MQTLNETIFLLLNGLTHQSTFTDWLIIFCAQYVAYLLVASTVLYVYFHTSWRKGAREVIIIFFSAALAYLIASTIKHFYVHDRPFIFFSNISPLISPDSPHGSFPSGHATFFAALAVAFLYYHRRLGVLYLIGALIIGLARIVVGVHWPFDIAAGYLLGGIIAVSVHFVVEKLKIHDRFGLNFPA